jgi:hypothetical protein
MNRIPLGCTLAAASLAALVAGSAAQAQVWFEYRSWGGARVYEVAPPDLYGRGPVYMAPDALPRPVVRGIVERRGFAVTGPLQLSGDVYVVPVEDRRGRTMRIVVDAASGQLVERIPFEGPPRPPAAMGRARDRYATAPYGADPYATDLPPPAPRGGWRNEQSGMPVPPPPVNEGERRARERFARQTPDGAASPRGRMNDLDTPPALRPGASAPAPRAPEPRREPANRTTQEQRKQPAKQQAARTPAEAKKPEVVKLAPQTTGAAKPAEAPKAERPRTAPPKVEVSRPEAKPEANTTVVAPTPKPEASKPQPSGNASVLRRPAPKADDAKPGERKGVAEGPVISSGAEPQRRAPRVVYPGPGAQAPAPSSE